jgi:hypothetical protein
MSAPSWVIDAIVGIVAAGPLIVTGLLAYFLAGLLKSVRAVVIVVLCGLSGPAAVLVFAWLSPLTKPDPRSVDGPAYVLVGLLALAVVLLPLCLAASAAGTWLRRRTGRSQSPKAS